MKYSVVFIVFVVFSCAIVSGQSNKRTSAHVLSQTLQNGRLSNSEADLYFEFPEGKMLMYNSYPDNFIFISNPLGEARIYYPAKNQVIVQANNLLTSQNNNLYHFLSNQSYDLGLGKLGFIILDSGQEESYFVTHWQAPARMLDQIDKIKLVHENLLPVHADYSNIQGNSILKVYYDDYKDVHGSQLPSVITEIVFLPGGDSLIKRMQYSDFRSGSEVDESKYKFVIPDDAKILK